jgi:hypothetical protein
MAEVAIMIVACFVGFGAFFWILEKKDEDMARWMWGDNYEYLTAMIERNKLSH